MAALSHSQRGRCCDVWPSHSSRSDNPHWPHITTSPIASFRAAAMEDQRCAATTFGGKRSTSISVTFHFGESPVGLARHHQPPAARHDSSWLYAFACRGAHLRTARLAHSVSWGSLFASSVRPGMLRSLTRPIIIHHRSLGEHCVSINLRVILGARQMSGHCLPRLHGLARTVHLTCNAGIHVAVRPFEKISRIESTR